VLLAQQGWPAAPQVTHIPLLPQTALAWQTLPVQQGWLPRPQAMQLPPWQIEGIGPAGPAVGTQAAPVGQQFWPSIPQGWQSPF
jgi:hypothetical protein